MRALLHLVSVILLLPSLCFSIAVALLTHAIAEKSLLSLFLELLKEAGSFIQWGLRILIPLLALIVGAGFSFRFRWLAGLVVAVLATLSAALLVSVSSWPITLDNLGFFVPGFISLCIGAWLAFTERTCIHSDAHAP